MRKVFSESRKNSTMALSVHSSWFSLLCCILFLCSVLNYQPIHGLGNTTVAPGETNTTINITDTANTTTTTNNVTASTPISQNATTTASTNTTQITNNATTDTNATTATPQSPANATTDTNTTTTSPQSLANATTDTNTTTTPNPANTTATSNVTVATGSPANTTMHQNETSTVHTTVTTPGNPCDPNPCNNSGLCNVNTSTATFKCLCIAEWTGVTCETDVDECQGDNPCGTNFKCANHDGGYSCTCGGNFRLIGKDCMKIYLFTYDDASAQRYTGSDIQTQPITFPIGFPYFQMRYQQLYAYGNGYVSFGKPFHQRFAPHKWPKYPALVSAYWADIDISADPETSGLFVYQERRFPNTSEVTPLLDDVEKAIDNAFKPLYAVVVTWFDGHPYPSNQNPDAIVRAQLVLTTDGVYSYVIRNYDVTWSQAEIQRIAPVSYSYSGDNGEKLTPEKTPGPSEGQTSFNELVTVSGISDASFQCAANLFDVEQLYKQNPPNLQPCPCYSQQAEKDLRFEAEANGCYTSLFPSGTGDKQRCCYDTYGFLLKDLKDASYPAVTFGTGQSLKDAYDKCCQTDIGCNWFYRRFPSDTCKDYVPLAFAGGFGDPHVVNFDGDKFSFNGMGVYTLAKKGDVEVQGLTAKDTHFNVTYFKSFAMMSNSSDGSIIVTYDVAQQTMKVTYTKSVRPPNQSYVIRKENETFSTLYHTGSDYYIIKVFVVDKSIGVLRVTVSMPSDTFGLLGHKNGDKSDDFQFRNGTNTFRGPASMLKGIQINEFAETWKVTNYTEALFGYSTQEELNNVSAPADYEPYVPPTSSEDVYISLKLNETLTKELKDVCQDELFCLQDYYARQSLDSARDTLKEQELFNNETEIIPNEAPSFTNDNNLTWTVADGIVQLTLQAPNNAEIRMDKQFSLVELDGPNVTFKIVDNLSALRDLPYPKTLSFVAMSTPPSKYQPEIHLCLCNETEQCVSGSGMDSTDVNGDPQGNVFNMDCKCGSEVTGRYCEERIDPCEKCEYYNLCNTSFADPCVCPNGYSKNGTRCLEINECLINNGGCDQMCTNTDGSNSCSCKSGFNTNGTKCIDIPECDNTTICSTEQICVELPGTYSCVCREGTWGQSCDPANYIYFWKLSILSLEWDPQFNDTSSKEFKDHAYELAGILDKYLQNEIKLDAFTEILSLEPQPTTNRRKRNPHPVVHSTIAVVAMGSPHEIPKAELDKVITHNTGPISGIYLLKLDRDVKSDACDFKALNHCDHDSSTCNYTDTKITCQCEEGFNVVINGPTHCKDVNECHNDTICGQGQNCTNTGGSYSCTCPRGHVWDLVKHVCVAWHSYCNPLMCQHDGVCVDTLTPPYFACICTDGYSGRTCADENNKVKDYKVAVICVGVILGVLCLALIIALIVVCARQKKSSHSSYRTPEQNVYANPQYEDFGALPRPKIRNNEEMLENNGRSGNYDSIDQSSRDKPNVSKRYTGFQDASQPHTYDNRAYDNTLSDRL